MICRVAKALPRYRDLNSVRGAAYYLSRFRCSGLGTTKCGRYHFLRGWRLGEIHGVGLAVIGVCQDLAQPVEGGIITPNRSRNHLLNAVVSRYVNRVVSCHYRLWIWDIAQPVLPASGPIVEAFGIVKVVAGSAGDEAAKRIGIIGAAVGHHLQQLCHQCVVAWAQLGQADFCAICAVPMIADQLWHRMDGCGE